MRHTYHKYDAVTPHRAVWPGSYLQEYRGDFYFRQTGAVKCIDRWRNGFRTGPLVTRLRNNTSLVLRTCYGHTSGSVELFATIESKRGEALLHNFFFAPSIYDLG